MNFCSQEMLRFLYSLAYFAISWPKGENWAISRGKIKYRYIILPFKFIFGCFF